MIFHHLREPKLLALVAVVVFLSAVAAGQTATTSLQGQVVDPQGAVIVGAKLTLTNTNTNASRSGTTGTAGDYLFASLPPGAYRLRVEAPGFRTTLQDNLQLLVNMPLRFNVTLQVGASQEVIEVSAVAERLNTVDASVGNAFAENQVKQLPLEARNVVGLLSLQTGAVFLPVPPTSSDNDPRSGSISGGHADQTNVTMDGVDVNDAQTGYAYTTVLRATLDSVQEFRVTTTNYGADQGRSSGAQVSLVTKSGSNALHGSGYWYHRNTAWSSNEFFNKLSELQSGAENKPLKLQKHIWGGSLGFAPIKNRLFFFANFENLRESAESSASRYVPSETMRDGILVYPCDDPTACPGGSVNGLNSAHTIPAGWFGVSPSQLAALDPLGIGPSVALSQYFQQFPSPNDTGRDGAKVDGQLIGNIVGYRFAAPFKNDWYTYITRLDFNVDRAGKHQLTWRGNLQNDLNKAVPQYCYGGTNCSPPIGKDLGNNKGMMVGYTAAFATHLVNNFRYGYTRVGVGTGGTLTSNYVDVRFIDDLNPYTATHYRIIPTHNFVDDLTWARGRHTFQFGANLRFTRVGTSSNVNSYKSVLMNGSWVAGNGKTYIPGRWSCPYAICDQLPAANSDAYASYADSWIDILGVLSEAGANYNYDRQGNTIPFGVPIKRHWGNNGFEFYGQDNLRIKPNFNLVFGVRWSYSSPPWETNGLQTGATTPLGDWFNQRAQNMLQGKPASDIQLQQYVLAGKANGRTGFYEPDYNNFGPHFAFTWSPQFEKGWLKALTGGSNKTVIRGGYGMVFDQVGLGIATQYDLFGMYGLTTYLESGWRQHNEDDPNIRFVDLTTVPNTVPPAPPGGFPYTPGTFMGAISQSIDSSIRTPYSQMFNFFIGRELPWKMSLDLGYVGRRASKVLARRDLAMPLNLVDPASKTDYFTAATQLVKALDAAGQDWTQLASIPYWENLFPTIAASYNSIYGADYGYVTNNTQAVGFNYSGMEGDYTTALYNMDEYGDPDYSKFGQFAYFDPQFDALGSISSVGRSNYNAIQASLRKQFSNGLQFDFNYTYSKSFDHSSAVERGSSWGTFGDYYYSNFLINSWDPKQSYGHSDFDVRHQINFNYVVELPFGKGRKLGGSAKGFLNGLIGGWQTTGILRVTSGFPFDVQNCRSCWPTNWEQQGNTQYTDLNAVRNLQNHSLNRVNGYPSPFSDPQKVLSYLRYSYPGEGGQRNRLRGDGYFSWDVGMGKAFDMPYNEKHKLKFRWEVFNLTNTARFNVANTILIRDFASTFGQYTSTYSGCDNAAGRCMQASLRYEF